MVDAKTQTISVTWFKKKLHFLTFLILKKTQKPKNPATQTLMESKRNLHFLFSVQLVANVFILVGRGGRWGIKIVVKIKE